MLIHTIGHLGGILTWQQTEDPVKRMVISQMLLHKFPFMGVNRSFGEYYSGFGHAATLSLLFIVFLLWIRSSRIKNNENLAKIILIGIAVFLFGFAIDEIIFFFPFATLFSLASAILTTIAIFSLPKHSAKSRQ